MSLSLNLINKSFEGKIIFDNFSYSFPDTGLYLITGESGRGKTTLLRMISGLDNNYVGSIDGGGIGKVGMAFQEYRLFPSLSAIENVIFAISDKKDKAVYENAKTMLLRLGIEEKDFILKPDELSGGMKQRISLARAFLSPYPILLLDEPTKELDSQNAQTVRRIITELSKEKLVIVVSHNSEDLSLPGAIEINLQ